MSLFSASQIAHALGKKRQAVQRLLAGVPASGDRVIKGNIAKVWSMESLPTHLQTDLREQAENRNYSSAEVMLIELNRYWRPRVPLAKCSVIAVEQARQLQAALARAIQLVGNGNYTAFERERIALDDYKREFKVPVSRRHIRDLIQRTLDRDGGAQNWARLEIYLPDLAAEIEKPKRLIEQFAALSEYIDLCSTPASDAEKRGAWTAVFEEYGRLVAQGMTPKKAARKMRSFISEKAPFLAPSRDALLKAFDRKLNRWLLSGHDPKSLRDGREENGAKFELPDEDRDQLVWLSVAKYRGDVSPAWRDLMYKGFSDGVRRRYAGKAYSKSHVPTSVRESIAAEVEILTVMHQGPRAFDSIKGHVSRDYSRIPSLKAMTADDFTMPVYFYVPDGKGWFHLTRGQILIFSDFRTARILGWSIQPDRNYSSLVIRSLCTHVFSEHGVPPVLQFERGIWERATLIKGRESSGAVGFNQVIQGLREFGIKFIHSIRPRSKTIELIGGKLQDLMEGEPGYCGRNERIDAPESLRKQMAAVESRAAGSLNWFYSYDEWQRRFGQIVEQYNATAQQGKMCGGLSPDEAFAKFADPNDPPMHFSSAVRYLLAHDKRPARVTLNGITIQIGKKRFNYRGKEISHLVGHEVLAWFDPENTDTLVVTNMDRENPICVTRSNEPSALESVIDPESRTLGRELARVEDQASHMKARYTVLKSKFQMPVRKTIADAQSIALGREIEEQKAKQTTAQKLEVRARGAYGRLNMVAPLNADREAIEAAEDLRRLLKECKKED